MGDLGTRYAVSMKVLSPLHIGSGGALVEGFDYLVRNDKAYVVNQDALMEQVLRRAEDAGRGGDDLRAVTDAIMAMSLDDLEKAGYLLATDLEPSSSLVRYALRGRPAMREIREHIKDVYDQPYVPGSSVKGAMRTALAWWAFRELGMAVDPAEFRGAKKERVAQAMEKKIFGPDPNHDLLRALLVSDSAPLGGEHLKLATIRVHPSGGSGQKSLDLAVEVLGPRAEPSLRVRIDGFVLGQQVAGQLGLGTKPQWLTQLPAICRQHAAQRIEHCRRTQASDLERFYQWLQKRLRQLDDSAFLLQMSWGAGWGAKTLGSRLKSDAEAFGKIVRTFRLSRTRQAESAGFPSSRRVVVTRKGSMMPLGWVQVTMTEVDR